LKIDLGTAEKEENKKGSVSSRREYY